MLDYLVLYDSETGNTKRLAAAIFSCLPGNSKDLIDITTEKLLPEATFYLIGFCVHRGTCRMAVSNFVNSLTGKKIVLFGTCGMGNSPDYYNAIEHSASAWIEGDNEYLGAYFCQGKMPLKVRQKYEAMKTDENAEKMELYIRNFDEAMTHPNQRDIEHAEAFIKKCLNI